ncbi:MAG: DUF922 domain-containing protein [Kaistella sp.]|nr:DUF922 domain-containing protein [Kaistella sp.]
MRIKFLITTALLLTNFLFAQKIFWKEGEQLIWEDFQGSKNETKADNVVAYTYCGWMYSGMKSTNPNAKIEIKLQTVFSPEKSWKDPLKINDEVLNHEQKHFDIAELFARKLRKEIGEKIKTSRDFDRYFKSLYNRHFADYQKFQDRYDGETKHGTNKEKQLEFNTYITTELDKYNQYQES